MIHVGLADDDALVRHTLTDLLATTEDVRIVWSARDGEEALAALQAPDNPVEVLLLDIQMPRLDGIALAEALHEDRPELAILILTTFVADAILDRALAAGVRGFIAKEDPVSALTTTIRHVAAKTGSSPPPPSSADVRQMTRMLRRTCCNRSGSRRASPLRTPCRPASRSPRASTRSSPSWWTPCPTSRSPTAWV